MSHELAQSVDLATRLALRPKEAAAAIGVSERTMRQLLPSIPHVREGGVVLVPVDGLRAWLLDQANAKSKTVDSIVKSVVADIGGQG